MMFFGPPPGGPPGSKFEYAKVMPPRNLRDVPRYLREVCGGFFKRMAYIVSLVWKTGPWILILKMFIALFQGIMPVFSAFISKYILNALQASYDLAKIGAATEIEDFLVFRPAEAISAIFGGNATASTLALLAFSFLVFLFIYNILNSIVSRISTAVTRIGGEMVVCRVKTQIMEKTKTLDLASFDLPAFYEKLENANREAGNRPIQIMDSTFSIVSTVISLVSYVVILVASPGLWWTAPVMVAVTIPTAIVSFKYRKKNFTYMRRRSTDRRQMNYYSDLMVNKDIAKEVRMFNLSDTFIGRYRTVFKKYFSGIIKLTLQESAWHLVITIISSIINCVFFAMVAFRVFTGEMMIGDYSLYTGALMSISGCVTALINISATIYEGTLFIDNLISFMEEKQTVVPIVPEAEKQNKEYEPPKPQHDVPHTIVFENVSFAYPGSDHRVLDNINLTLRPGETMVLVGLNGAGKTTLIKLLTRLYDPTEGRILLDGRDLREYDVADLYKLFGIIFQDFGKYAVSVSENIHYGDIDREFDEKAIKEAATQSNANDYIEKLSNGYDTQLMKYFDPDGTELSIGQWQKLAIARAFYSRSDILILDEPTASLDPMAEQEIFNQFDRLRSDKTTIFVSHRLSSATIASKIVVLEYGKILEEGTHRELMAKHGRYYELFSTQAKRYISEGEYINGDAPEDFPGEMPPNDFPKGFPKDFPKGFPMPPDGKRPPMPPHGRPPMPPDENKQ